MNGLEEVTKMAERLAPGDQLKLVEHIAHKLQRKTAEKKTADLYGTWKGKFSEDIDVLREIREIRDEWKKKFDDLD